MITVQLREVIRASGLTGYALGQAADVHPSVIGRFLAGQTDIRAETLDRLAAALGLRLTSNSRRAARGPAPDATPPDGVGQAVGP